MKIKKLEHIRGDSPQETIDFVLEESKNYISQSSQVNLKDTYNLADDAMQLLEQTFNGRIISKIDYIHWSERSSDLTPMDFFWR